MPLPPGTQQEEVCESCYDEVCARCSSDGNDLSEVGDVRTNGYPVCEKPPRGSSAWLSGTTVATLSLNKGYYRTANSSHAVRMCFLENACPGGDDTDMYCAPGYTGPCEKVADSDNSTSHRRLRSGICPKVVCVAP